MGTDPAGLEGSVHNIELLSVGKVGGTSYINLQVNITSGPHLSRPTLRFVPVMTSLDLENKVGHLYHPKG